MTISRLEDCARSARGTGPPAVPSVMSVVSAWAAPVQAAIIAIATPAVIANKERSFAFMRILPCFRPLTVFRQVGYASFICRSMARPVRP